jgi:hypothetical protein
MYFLFYSYELKRLKKGEKKKRKRKNKKREKKRLCEEGNKKEEK